MNDPRAPSGVVTFLFTDIEGSTRRWDADADAMRSALAAHDEVLRDAIDSHGGWLFKHTGDGVCAVFASPEPRSRCRGRRPTHARVAGADGYRDRRGRIARRRLLRRGTQPRCAGDVRRPRRADPGRRCNGGAAQRVDLIELGQRRLRDIAKAVEISQVRADGLRADFPPLITLDATPGNLRPPRRASSVEKPKAPSWRPFSRAIAW